MEKPFIKLFHTPNSGYFYDVGKNEVIRIPESVYRHLSCVVQGSAVLEQPDDEDVLDMINSFKELGYLSSKRPEKIQHSATAMVPLLLDRCIDKITLQLTQDCNFRCKYCIYSEVKNLKQRSHARKSMSLDTAKRAIFFYRDHAVDSNMYNIGFYGGEPLLEWDLLKDVVLFAERELQGKRLIFTVTTNASLLTEHKVVFLEEHNVNTVVSLDGIQEINDQNRVFKDGRGTIDTVLRNLQLVKEKHPDFFEQLYISSVIDPGVSVGSFGKYPDLIRSLPLDHYLISVEDNSDHEVELPYKLSEKMEEEAFLAHLADFGLYTHEVKPYGYCRVRNLHSHINALKPAAGVRDVMAPGGPCIPGKSRLFVTVDGDLYPCERVNEIESNCIGNLESGIDYEKARRILNIGTITENKCKNCWALRLCTLCIRYFDYTSKSSAMEKVRFCDSVESAARERIRGLIMLYEFEKYYKSEINRGKQP